MKWKKTGIAVLLVLACILGCASASAESVNVVNPKGTVLVEGAEVLTNADGIKYVDLGNGFELYGGADGVLGTVDDIVQNFGSYPQSDVTGAVKDPLNWRLLDIKDGAATLIADKVVNAVFFNVDAKAGVDWKSSNLRSWLNSRGGVSYKGDTVGFYDAAFTAEEKEKILLTNVRMDYSNYEQWDYTTHPAEFHGTRGNYPVFNKLKDYYAENDTTGLSQREQFEASIIYAWDLHSTTGEATDDYVYAISGEEVFEYFGECDASRYEGWPTWMLDYYTNGYFNCSEYALAQGAKINGGSQPSFYYFADTWTRSPGAIKEDGTCTGVSFATNGDINFGRDVNVVQNDTTYGALPMIRVNLGK